MAGNSRLQSRKEVDRGWTFRPPPRFGVAPGDYREVPRAEVNIEAWGVFGLFANAHVERLYDVLGAPALEGADGGLALGQVPALVSLERQRLQAYDSAVYEPAAEVETKAVVPESVRVGYVKQPGRSCDL